MQSITILLPDKVQACKWDDVGFSGSMQEGALVEWLAPALEMVAYAPPDACTAPPTSPLDLFCVLCCIPQPIESFSSVGRRRAIFGRTSHGVPQRFLRCHVQVQTLSESIQHPRRYLSHMTNFSPAYWNTAQRNFPWTKSHDPPSELNNVRLRAL